MIVECETLITNAVDTCTFCGTEVYTLICMCTVYSKLYG